MHAMATKSRISLLPSHGLLTAALLNPILSRRVPRVSDVTHSCTAVLPLCPFDQAWSNLGQMLCQFSEGLFPPRPPRAPSWPVVEREEAGDFAHLLNAESTGIAAGTSPAAVLLTTSWGVWAGCRSDVKGGCVRRLIRAGHTSLFSGQASRDVVVAGPGKAEPGRGASSGLLRSVQP
jgi:hypothetical protein